MKTQWKRVFAALSLAVAVGIAGVSLSQAQEPAPPPAAGGKAHYWHPEIRHAVKALEKSMEYMEHAKHDFEGHRVQALKDCEQALGQLRICMETPPHHVKGEKPVPPPTTPPPSVEPKTPHRHPEIHAAIRALEHAMKYMEHAAHDFGGHRVQAMKDCEQALGQLRICLEVGGTHGNNGAKPVPPPVQ